MSTDYGESNDPGMFTTFGLAGSAILDEGFYRVGVEDLLDQVDDARLYLRSYYIQWAVPQVDAQCATYTQSSAADSTFHALSWPALGGTDEPTFDLRVRRNGIRGFDSRAPCRLRLIYKATAGLEAAVTLRLTEANSGETFDVACPATGAFTEAHATLELPTDTTDQEIEFTLSLRVVIASGSCVFYLAAALLVSDEPELGALATWDWSATTQPADLNVSRSGTRYLIDDAAQSHLTPYGANAWDTEIDAEGTRYSPRVPAYANDAPTPRDITAADWSTGGARTANTAVGPDGATLADTSSCASAGFGHYETALSAASSAKWAVSAWYRTASGTGLTGLNLYDNVGLTRACATATVTTAWARQTVLASFGASTQTFFIAVDGRDWTAFGGSAAGARDVRADFHQRVAGLTYVPPYTPAAVGDCSAWLDPSMVVQGGYFDITLALFFVSYEAATTPTFDQYLLYVDADTHLRFRASDDKFVLVVDGVEAAVAAFASIHAAGELFGLARVWSRADSCGFQIGQSSATATAANPIATPLSDVFLFDTGSGGGLGFPCKAYGRGVSRATAPA